MSKYYGPESVRNPGIEAKLLRLEAAENKLNNMLATHPAKKSKLKHYWMACP